MKKNITILLLLLLLSAPLSYAAKLHVTFINPGYPNRDNPTGPFWNNVAEFMQAAANDFDMDLEIIYCKRNHVAMNQLALEVIDRTTKPDYLVIVNEKSAATHIVEEADKKNIKTVFILNGFNEKQLKETGLPRQNFKNWLGTIAPDNFTAGYKIATRLIEEAKDKNKVADDGMIHIIGIAGDHNTPASVARNSGLKKAVAVNPETVLEQIIVGKWSKNESAIKAEAALKRYPKTNIIWAANDPMALGAMLGVQKKGKTPGKDLLIGGLNWDTDALEKIKSGEMVVSVGGHFMTGGWALVMLYDYHHGVDFSSEGLRMFRDEIFGVIDARNVDSYLNYFADRKWDKIDFQKFSKIIHPEIEKYNFSLNAILKQDLMM